MKMASEPYETKKAAADQKCASLKACLLKSWQPVATYGSNIMMFFILGLILLVIGGVLMVVNSTVQEYVVRYDNVCGNATNCSVSLTIDDKMLAPVYFYYGLDGFFQNHRNYIKSKDNAQLEGEERTVAQVRTNCYPIVYNRNISYIPQKWVNNTLSIQWFNNTPLDPNAVANPCGLIAKSFFNDTYNMTKPNSANPVNMSESGIAWASDRAKFKNSPNAKQTQWIDLTDEHFIVWMRISGLSNFKKLWARIDEDLEPGTYNITIQNNYQYSGFKGPRSVVLSTLGPFGGKNEFLAISYLAIGGSCWLISGYFLIRYLLANKEKNS